MVFRASEAKRNRECKGSYNAALGLLAPSSKAADEGTLVHEAAKVVVTDFSLSNIDDLDKRIETFSDLFRLNSWGRFALDFLCTEIFDTAAEHGGARAVIRESAYTIPLTTNAEMRATPDCSIFMGDESLHTFEYKSGHASQELSDVNDQGQAQVACVVPRFEVPEMTHHMLSAGNDRSERHTKTTYTRSDAKRITGELADMSIASADPKAERTPGKHCTWCPAKGTWHCPESLVAAQSMIVRPVMAIADALPADRARFIKLVLEKWPVIKDQLIVGKELIRKDPSSVPGVGLRDTGSNRKFADDIAAMTKIRNAYDLPDFEIMQAAGSLSVTKIEAFLWTVEKHLARKQGRKPRRQSDVVAAFRKDFADDINIFPKDQALVVLD